MTDNTPRELLQRNTSTVRNGFLSIDPRVVWPVLILLCAGAIYALMMATKPTLDPKVSERSLAAVRVLTVTPQKVQLTVRSQGTVKPMIESNLTPEVSGSVVWISPALVSGGNFDQAELLLRIDDKDYRNAVDRNRARVERADVEHELSESEYHRQARLNKQKLTSQSQVDQADRAHRVAEANLTEMQVDLQRAELDLKRTQIYAAFGGRVRNENVDVGQFVSRGETVASLYATDTVEVRLPIANRQLAYMAVPASAKGILEPENAPSVTIRGEYGGLQYQWQSALVRTEAEIDARTRMIYGVARVDNPEVRDIEHPPLLVGLFVHAEIAGRIVDDVVRLPRTAMRDHNQVLVVDEDNRLRFRDVALLRMEHDEVLISSGLQAGERVCISPLQVVVEGMKVQPVDVTISAPGAPVKTTGIEPAEAGAATPDASLEARNSDAIAE